MVYKILAAIFAVVVAGVSYYLGYIFGKAKQKEESNSSIQQIKSAHLRESMFSKAKDMGWSLEKYFTNRGYSKIVIYGLGAYYNELLTLFDTDKFETIYLGDKNASSKNFKDKIYRIYELKDIEFDAVLVTSIAHYIDIKAEMTEAGINCPIISYEDLIYNAGKE